MGAGPRPIAAQAAMGFVINSATAFNPVRSASMQAPISGPNPSQVTMLRLCGPALAGSNAFAPT